MAAALGAAVGAPHAAAAPERSLEPSPFGVASAAAAGDNAGLAPTLRTVERTARQRRNGSVIVHVVCPAASIHRCRGVARLRTTGKLPRRAPNAAAPRGHVALGRVRYTLKPGQRAQLVVKLSAKRLAQLVDTGARTVRLHAVTQMADGPPSTAAWTLRLAPQPGR